MLSAMVSLTLLAAGVAFTRFVSSTLERNDWVGWTATGLLAVIAVSGAVIILRELIGILRLARLSRLRRELAGALRSARCGEGAGRGQGPAEAFLRRPELKWGLGAHWPNTQRDVRDPGDLLALADRELLAPLDNEARRIILKAAKRVSVVTALSPMVWIAMSYVLMENLRLLRQLAGLYGGRPGFIGSFRLAGMVVGHIIATGGLALYR